MAIRMNKEMNRQFTLLGNALLLSTTLVCAVLCSLPVGGQSAGNPLVLPVRYDEDRFYVQPVTSDGITLNFFTDTGGGLFVFSDVVERLKLPVISIEADEGQKFNVVKLPEFKDESVIPAPLGNREQLFVVPSESRDLLTRDWSGILGHQWFAGRVWTFDYPKRQLLLRAGGDLPASKNKHRVALGFRSNSSGGRATNYPRIPVTINGETIELLFDTGATTRLSEAALAVLKDNRAAIRATSFVTASVFEKWRKQNPRWRVIEKAETQSDEAMIEVPKVVIAGYTVRRVWFTRRPDKNFKQYTKWMDKPIDGALGGNALRHFRISVDYPRAIAVFER
ncbi:MAG: hypothetical protein WKF74_04275 [Pyrinomonadaceae bacterium]